YSNFHMKYNNVEQTCAASGDCTVSGLALPGTSATLLVGAVVSNTNSASGTVTPTFNVGMTESGHSVTNSTNGTGNIKFDTPLSFGKNPDINLRSVRQGVVGAV